jgi:hypothetical protein
MDARIADIEKALARAEALGERVREYTDAGRRVPPHLAEESAKADEELLQKLLALEQARRRAE